jgi:prepilin-type N-terminal cleavage/methylation domain-containing protein
MVINARVNRNGGFTLTEIMITVAILGIVMMVGPNLLLSITRFSRLSRARIETQRSARIALNQINQSLRQASSSSITVSQETGQPPLSSVSFSTVDNRNMKFYQSGKNLYYVLNGSTRTLSDGLRYIAFSYPRTDDATIMSVSLTFEKDTYQGGSKALQMAIEKVRIMD